MLATCCLPPQQQLSLLAEGLGFVELHSVFSSDFLSVTFVNQNQLRKIVLLGWSNLICGTLKGCVEGSQGSLLGPRHSFTCLASGDATEGQACPLFMCSIAFVCIFYV